MKIIKSLVVVIILGTATVSCTDRTDEQIEILTQSTGGEDDDYVDPDREGN